jgi:hypothetical protein
MPAVAIGLAVSQLYLFVLPEASIVVKKTFSVAYCAEFINVVRCLVPIPCHPRLRLQALEVQASDVQDGTKPNGCDYCAIEFFSCAVRCYPRLSVNIADIFEAYLSSGGRITFFCYDARLLLLAVDIPIHTVSDGTCFQCKANDIPVRKKLF